MTFLLNNILPSNHNSDLPLPKCQLVYTILTHVSIHVAQLISEAIYQFAGITPPRHPVDLEKSNRALGFPALITGLCQFYGVTVTPVKLIRPPINRAFIEKYYVPRQAPQQGQTQQQEEGQQQLATDATDQQAANHWGQV